MADSPPISDEGAAAEDATPDATDASDPPVGPSSDSEAGSEATDADARESAPDPEVGDSTATTPAESREESTHQNTDSAAEPATGPDSGEAAGIDPGEAADLDTSDAADPDTSEAADPDSGEVTGGAADSDPASTSPWEPGTFRAAHAETAAEFAEFWSEHDLDFTPASLARLDDLVDAQWTDERFADTTFGGEDSFDDRAFTSVVRELGGYFGEVLVRHLDGEWTDETDHEAAVLVSGEGGQFAVPVFEVAMTSLRKQSVFGRSYDALLADLGRDGPTR